MPTTSTLFRLAAVGFLGLGVGLQIWALAVPTWAIFTIDDIEDLRLNGTFDQQVGPYRLRVVKYDNGTGSFDDFSTWEGLGASLPVNVILTRGLSLLGAFFSALTFVLEAYMVFSVLGNQSQHQDIGAGPGLSSGRLGFKTHARENAYLICAKLSWIGFSFNVVGYVLWIRLQFLLYDAIPYARKSEQNIGYGFIVSIVGGVVVAIGLVLTKLWLRFS